MDASSITYIQVALVIISLMLAGIFFMAWRTLGGHVWALRWSWAYAALAAYWLAHLNAAAFPSFGWYWLTANACGLLMLTLALRGHCQRTDCEYLPDNLWPIALLFFMGIMWTTFVSRHLGLSAAIFPLLAAITLLMSAAMIVAHRRQTRAAEYAAAISMAVFAVAQLPVAVYAYGLGPHAETVREQLFAHPSVLLQPAGLIGMGMFIVFMLASDLYEDMKEIAVRDGLTGLYNRRGFGEQARIAYANARRRKATVSVIAADIDHFKSVNDEFGHAIGDEALQHFAGLLSASRRVEDIVARIGGEEFVLVLPGTDIREATAIADRLCVQMASSPMVSAGRQIVMTASFGVATIAAADTCMTDIIIKADRALYRSKRAGRNRVDLESSQLLRNIDGSLEAVAKPATTAK